MERRNVSRLDFNYPLGTTKYIFQSINDEKGFLFATPVQTDGCYYLGYIYMHDHHFHFQSSRTHFCLQLWWAGYYLINIRVTKAVT